MEQKILAVINDERAARNIYYRDYNEAQNVDDETLEFYLTMYLVHEYAYATLCGVADCEYHKVADDYNEARGRRL